MPSSALSLQTLLTTVINLPNYNLSVIRHGSWGEQGRMENLEDLAEDISQGNRNAVTNFQYPVNMLSLKPMIING